MSKLILVKYASEIFLKGLNRNKFEKKLRDNIAIKLEGLNFEIISDQNRYFIKVDEINVYGNFKRSWWLCITPYGWTNNS